jgi:hypothetical protein
MRRMRKKDSVASVASHELSRLLTRERLRRAGVKVGNADSGDPDLDAIAQRVRSTSHKTESNTPSVPASVVRKLVGG